MRGVRLEAFAERQFLRNNIAVHFRSFFRDQQHVMAPAVMVTVAEGEYTAPALQLNADEAQRLMDELWQVGIRPTEGTGSAGSLAATQAHLVDMKTLTYRLLDQVERHLVKP